MMIMTFIDIAVGLGALWLFICVVFFASHYPLRVLLVSFIGFLILAPFTWAVLPKTDYTLALSSVDFQRALTSIPILLLIAPVLSLTAGNLIGWIIFLSRAPARRAGGFVHEAETKKGPEGPFDNA